MAIKFILQWNLMVLSLSKSDYLQGIFLSLRSDIINKSHR